MVVKRQCVFVLHGADVAEFVGTNGKYTARAECVGIARTFRSKRRNADTSKYQDTNEDFTHNIADRIRNLEEATGFLSGPQVPILCSAIY